MLTTANVLPPIAPCVIALVVAAASTDLQCRRIPNPLVGAGLFGALLVQCWLKGIGAGAMASLTGAVVGLALFLPFYLVRGMAAGDVKLLAMVGAWIGPLLVFYAALATCVIGGAWMLVLIVRRHQLGKVWANLRVIAHPALQGSGSARDSIDSVGSVPYGVAIAAGTIAVLLTASA
ncbi:prepilin peptidase [Paraburkholderia phenoliruptrix]|uniref:prepilin peptidase n=1 Tax=Paraburkholderia phenoliruptrix TaxID=252970 RepID=UPI0034CF6613